MISFNLSSARIYKLLILLNLSILVFVPQLNNIHYDPLPQFWAEITFVWGLLFLFVLVCLAETEVTIPFIVIPLLLLALFLSVQPYLVKIDFVGLSYVTAIEFVLCALLAISISTIITSYGLKTFVTYLCFALVIGGILQSIIGLIQYTGLYRYFGNIIFYDGSHPTSNIFGHFGQRNHYCDYLSITTFGLIYLYQRNKIHKLLFFILLAWFTFSMTIASSRSVFIYFGIACALSFIYFICRRTVDDRAKKLFFTMLIASIILILIQYLYPVLQQMFSHHSHTVSSGLDRILSSNEGALSQRRLIEWEKAYMVFKAYPIFGYGWNEYAKQSIALHHLFPHAATNDGLFTNCHNLILQFMAETGAVGTLILITGIVYSIYRILQNACFESTIIICMAFTILAHSMLEYPLWYIYFLGPLVMFLSIDTPIVRLNSNVMATLATIPVLGTIYLIIAGSTIFNNLVDYSDTPTDQPSFTSQAKYLENIANHNILWSYPALYTLDDYINVDEADTNETFTQQEQLDYETRFTDFHPYPDNLIKLAMLNWNLGNKDTAAALVKQALVAYPVYKKSYHQTLKAHKYAPLDKLVP
jgi:O-antigen ligase